MDGGVGIFISCFKVKAFVSCEYCVNCVRFVSHLIFNYKQIEADLFR